MRPDELQLFNRAVTQVHDAKIHVDTSACEKFPTKFILVGKHSGRRDYVHVFELMMRDMQELVDLLAMLVFEYRVELGYIDAPCNISEMVRRQLQKMGPLRR